MMNLLISLLVFALVFSGALAGMAVRPLLSEHHLHSDSKDVVKLTVGLIGTLTALVLGLLIASANTTFDQKTNRVREMTATVIPARAPPNISANTSNEINRFIIFANAPPSR